MCRKSKIRCGGLTYLASFFFLLGPAAGAANADLTSGLVGYYPLDEGVGDIAYDLSGSGHDGTRHNNVTWISQGYSNSGVSLDGTANTRIELGTWNPAEGTGQMSVAMWIRWDGGPATYQGLLGKRDTWPGTTMFQFQVRPENEGTFRLETGTNAVVSPNGTLNPLIGEWAHVAATFDGTTARLYLNGQEIMSGGFAFNAAGEGSNMGIGCVTGGGTGYSGNGEVFSGDIDEVFIYNRALSEDEIQSVMGGLEGYPYASRPVPNDGAIRTETWVNCQWKAGDFAVSHNIYFGDNFADVNTGTGGTFRGKVPLTTLYFIAGFANHPYPDGLVPGTTYYWRIDEVNDADPNSPWKGNIWSFSIPSRKAHEPAPADGAKFIDPDVTLSWTGGFNAVEHHVYFGDNPEDVAAGTPDTDKGEQGPTSFVPGTLEQEKTYYWRVDESDDAGATHTGDVWSFTTVAPNPGIKAEYYHWSSAAAVPPPRSAAFGTLVLTRIESDINHQWGEGSPDPLVNVDQFAGRWTAELDVPFSEPYTFWTFNDDGVRVWLDGELIIDDWYDHGAIWNPSQPIDLVAGQRYALVMEYFENAGGATAELDWESPSMPRQVIPAGPLQLPLRASIPDPFNGATGVKETPTLTWKAGEQAVQHDVFFGTDRDAVKNATTASTEYRETRALGAESFQPGELLWDTTYYWRVDEVNNLDADSPWKGNVWSFSTGDFLVVEDFEDYKGDEVPVLEQIWGQWRDGAGFGAPGAPPYYPGNGTGSEVGDVTTDSYTEETIYHGAFQSMPYWYNNNKQGYFKYSEAKLTLTSTRDWTAEGVKALSLWFRGYPASVGSFTDNFDGTYTMTASGGDIWGQADEFHFAFKTLTGPGTIIARVDSILDTNVWAKAGVMIRETLEPGSAHAFACITPGYGISRQGRRIAGDDSTQENQAGITAPHWVKLERDMGGEFTVSHSTDGSAWEPVEGADPQNVPMNPTVYVGLAVTAHNDGNPVPLVCEAAFSNVTITGNVSGQWTSQDIGIQSNDAEPMYVAVANNTGQPAVVYHDDPDATKIDTWTEWNIDLRDFAGINLADVNSIAIGFGDRDNPQPGTAGKMYFDDIRLYRPRCVPAELTLSEADLNSDCVVDFRDLEIMVGDWLAGDPALAADLNADSSVDLKDYAALAEAWLDEQIWPEP